MMDQLTISELSVQTSDHNQFDEQSFDASAGPSFDSSTKEAV